MELYKTVKKKVQSELRSMENKWWDDLASQIEAASERNDSKTLYNLLNKAYGPQKSGVTPLRSKDGKSLLSETTEISNRWREHFSDLLNQPSSVDNEVVDSIEQRPTIEQLALPPTREEVSLAIKNLVKQQVVMGYLQRYLCMEVSILKIFCTPIYASSGGKSISQRTGSMPS